MHLCGSYAAGVDLQAYGWFPQTLSECPPVRGWVGELAIGLRLMVSDQCTISTCEIWPCEIELKQLNHLAKLPFTQLPCHYAISEWVILKKQKCIIIIIITVHMNNEDLSEFKVATSTSRMLLNSLGALCRYGVIFSMPTRIVPI